MPYSGGHGLGRGGSTIAVASRALGLKLRQGGGGIITLDTFTGAGVALQDHVGEIGAAWTKHPVVGPNGQAVIGAENRLFGVVQDPPGWTAYYSSGVPISPDYSVSARLRWKDNFLGKFGGPTHGGLYVREATGVDTGYHVRTDSTITLPSGFLLVRSGAVILAQAVQGFVVNQDYELQLIAEGARIRFLMDGVTVFDVVDAAPVLQVGRAGVLLYNWTISDETHGVHIDNFLAQQL